MCENVFKVITIFQNTKKENVLRAPLMSFPQFRKTRYPRLVSLSTSELAKAVHLGPGCYRYEDKVILPKDPSR